MRLWVRLNFGLSFFGMIRRYGSCLVFFNWSFSMSASDVQMIHDGLNACVFLLGLLSGLFFFSLFGKRWFF